MNISRKALCTVLLSLLTITACCIAEADESAIETQVDEIKYKYDLQVHYIYIADEYFPHRWRDVQISARGTQLPLEEVERLLPLIHSFLSSNPKPVLNENLRHIYLLSELYFYGKSYGATNSKTGLYIKSEGKKRGFSDSFLLRRMYSEFSSVLMRNHEFPKEKWQRINPAGFKYLGSGREMLGEGNLYGQNEKLLSKGFLVRYSQSSMENDFNMISDWLFTRASQLSQLGRNHKKIQAKMNLAIRFYKSIDEGYDFR